MQIMVSVGRSAAALWDAQAGTFLGTVTPASAAVPSGMPGMSPPPVDADDENAINTTVGLQLDTVTLRAMHGVGTDVPPLGAPLREEASPDDQSVAHKLDTAAKTAHSFASSFAKKCGVSCRHCNAPCAIFARLTCAFWQSHQGLQQQCCIAKILKQVSALQGPDKHQGLGP